MKQFKQSCIFAATAIFITLGITSNLLAVTAKQAAKNAKQTQAENDADAYNEHIAVLQEQSFIDQFNALAAAGIAQISPAQIATIASSLIPFITNDQIAEFTAIQIPAFTATQIPAFSPSQMATFTVAGSNINQMAAFTAAQIAVMNTAQIAAMSVAQINEIIANLSTVQTQALVQAQLQGLSTPTLAQIFTNLTKAQIRNINLSQIVALGTTILPAIANLSPAQFLSLSQAQIQLMTNQNIADQLANLSTTHINYLLPAQIATITTDQINKMTKDQLVALQAVLQNSAIITTANNPALASQIAAITKAGVPPAPAPVAKKSNDLNGIAGSTQDLGTFLSKGKADNNTTAFFTKGKADKGTTKFFKTGKI